MPAVDVGVGLDWDVDAEIAASMRRTGLPLQVWFARDNQQPPSKTEFEEVGEGRLPIKPSGGFWTSSFRPHDQTWVSDWDRWCGYNGYLAGNHAYVLQVSPDATVIEIESLADLKRLVKTYYDTEFYDGWDTAAIRDYPIDFETLADDGIDGLRVTQQGLRETHLPGRNEPNLYGWDAESTVWLSWAFDGVVADLGTLSTDRSED